MRRTEQEIADEIMRRAEELEQHSADRRRKIFAALSFCVCLVVVIALAIATPL